MRPQHPETSQHMGHWGMFRAESADGEVTAVHPQETDRNPSPVLGNLVGSVTHRSRVKGPAVRRGWLERGPGPTDRRGSGEFVSVSWDELTELLAVELSRVIDRHGNQAIYGGSYGWASAGRFHHAQSQVHRFLNCIGGYTRSVHSYSLGATGVVMPHVLGAHWKMFSRSTSWDVIARKTELIVAFGGIPLKNTGINHGGTSDHPTASALDALRARGGKIVTISPLRNDLDGAARWMTPIPGTDVAMMLGLAHVLVSENLHDTAFLDRYCTGYARFEEYLLGVADGTPKTAEWASNICGVSTSEITDLAREMARRRTLITVTWSLQRTKSGEQAPWMGVTLASMLGQIGIPGGGFGHGYGSMNEPGLAPVPYPLPTLPQGSNPVKSFIPVAAVSDMLLHPGEEFDFDGQRLTYPDIRLVHWAGGNPFHHHQDLGRLRRALARPDTVVVHDPYWTPMAKHADIVVPSTTSLERSDISCTRNDPLLVAMHPAVPRFADARDDYDTFSALAERLGVGAHFTEGRTSGEWVEHLYAQWRGYLRGMNVDTPGFEEFWQLGSWRMATEDGLTLLEDYRGDPEKYPLRTPSGRIEIFSEAIEKFGYEDCIGHPAWYEPVEWLKGERAQQFPLHLIANQPRTRLHSQLDHGARSQASKVHGREPIRMHSKAASERGLHDGDVVRVFNDRGSCLAGVVVDEDMMPAVVQLATGAWYDPEDPADTGSMCVHGNPNVLTADVGTSSLSHGCTGQHVLVQIERFEGVVPPITAFDPPQFVERETIRRRLG
ncbi:molybdopterin-dependent oxidoreductase [Rhodococcus sp. H29-C3]|uniref:molybdopterin-dependent oxidoreductase n=1 Tax=Rhodococcus sp. H29-C3 TaxID=3046307 RepID=UPI0024BA3974|nr:molybdopterin-dependent oxidoreductase [Rhodococcus sp. H29-C3]MDJ0361526.1 molybdopterin-dependent oxidoreductase [Rhodococcus sp. H29-C3]